MNEFVSSRQSATQLLDLFRAVSINANGEIHYTDWPTTDSTSQYLGIILSNFITTTDYEIVHSGLIENNGWSWVIGKDIYLFYNGYLTQNIPINTDTKEWLGPIVKIGKAVSIHKILLYSSSLGVYGS